MFRSTSKRIMLIAAGLFVSASVFAQSLNIDDIVNPKYAAELKEKGIVSVIHGKEDTELSLIPSSVYSDMVKNGKIEKKSKNVPFVAEFLYLIPKKTLIENGSQGFEDISIDNVSVVFRSISKMTGMKYFSQSRGKENVLYKKAYMIADPESDEPIPDQNTGNADGQISYCYQDDHTYGDCKYKLEYYQNENELYASFLNTMPMSYLGIKAVMDGNLKINVIAIDCGENLLLYLSTDTDCKSIAFVNVRKQIQESMTSRMNAIYKWFLVQF